jgi:hypothetical protein
MFSSNQFGGAVSMQNSSVRWTTVTWWLKFKLWAVLRTVTDLIYSESDTGCILLIFLVILIFLLLLLFLFFSYIISILCGLMDGMSVVCSVLHNLSFSPFVMFDWCASTTLSLDVSVYSAVRIWVQITVQLGSEVPFKMWCSCSWKVAVHTAHELWGTQEQCYWKWQYIQHMSCEVLNSSVIEAVCHLGCDIAGGQIVMMFWWIAVLHWTAWPNDGGANTSSGYCVELHTQWCSVTFQNTWIFHM